MQTEGFDAAKKVDPNMVIKKKDGKEKEVQDGWVGHVLPFDLVQKAMLADDLAALEKLESRLSEIGGEYEPLLEEPGEKDKELDFVNEDKDGFVPAEVKKALKAKQVEPPVLAVLKKVDELIIEEKTLRRQIKADSTALHTKTKETIAGLSDAEVLELLHRKWIVPIVDGLHSLPETVVSDFTGKLDGFCKKYATTFAKVESEIADFVYNPCISVTAPVGPINRNKLGRCGVMSPLYSVFRPKGMDNTFLEQFFKSSCWYSFMRFNGDSGARSDRFSIKDAVFFEMPIPCPSLQEQELIGAFLSNLDHLITLHQKKLERLQNIKKSCLDKDVRLKREGNAWHLQERPTSRPR